MGAVRAADRELGHNRLRPHELLLLVRQAALVTIQGGQLRTLSRVVEQSVVVVGELLADICGAARCAQAAASYDEDAWRELKVNAVSCMSGHSSSIISR